jgi:hypothetical protein
MQAGEPLEYDTYMNSDGEQEYEIPAAPRQPSTVPLANINISPADIAQAQHQRMVGEEISRQAAPTAAEVKKATIHQIARDQAEKSRQRMQAAAAATPRDQARSAKAVRGNVDPDLFPGHSENCRVMNGYRERFSKGAYKISYKFRSHYDVQDPPEVVEMERSHVEILLNSPKTTDFARMCFLGGIQVLEGIAGVVTKEWEFQPLDGLTEDITKAWDAGLFSGDMEQLMVILEPYFALAPQTRVLVKVLQISGKTVLKNQKNSAFKANAVPPEEKERRFTGL